VRIGCGGPNSVNNLVGLLLPGAKRRQSLGPHQLDHWYLARGIRLRDLRIDQRIVEANERGIGRAVSETDASQVRPVDGAQAHRARLAGSKDFAIAQLEGTKLAARLTDGNDLRMCGGIECGGDLICSFGNDGIILDHHRAEGPAPTGMHILDRQLNRARHKNLVHVLPRKREIDTGFGRQPQILRAVDVDLRRPFR
jgi:hypothetical protein